jgi:hypothetical protein
MIIAEFLELSVAGIKKVTKALTFNDLEVVKIEAFRLRKLVVGGNIGIALANFGFVARLFLETFLQLVRGPLLPGHFLLPLLK